MSTSDKKKTGMRTYKGVKEEEEDWCECCAQWSLLLTNIPLMLIGLALVVLGSWTLSERSFLVALQVENSTLYVTIAAILVVAGVVLVVWSVYGCVAAFLENKRALLVYYVVVLLVFLVLCVVVMLGFVYSAKVSDHLRQELVNSVPAYDPERRSEPATKAWDRLQGELQCCGVATSPTDGADPVAAQPYTVWRNNLRLNSGSADARVPESCCLSAGTGGQLADCTSSTVADPSLIYTADCFNVAADYLKGHIKTLCVCSFLFAVFLALSASLSIALYFTADN